MNDRLQQQGNRRGTVLMECVLVLPILLLLIFAVVQFALIWYAQIMTHYAAYNAARAALVYHPGEYMETNALGVSVFSVSRGVCWKAACQTLAWVSSSPAWDAGTQDANGAYTLPIPGWFTVPYADHTAQQVRIVSGECAEFVSDLPAVKVTVAFDYPLHVPVVGAMLAGFAGEGKHPTMGTDYMTLKSTMLMPKLWSTKRYARIGTGN